MGKYISLGIACGKIDTSDRYYIMYRKQMYGMPVECYNLWRSFTNGRFIDSFFANGDSSSEDSCADNERYYKELRRLNLIVELKQSIHYLPMRQGTGLGYDTASEKYLVQCSQTIALPFICYYIWCYSDGKTSIMDIRKRLSEQAFNFSDEVLMNAYFQILLTDALVLV